MFSRKTKRYCFVLEGLNSFATVLYFYYFYFFMQKSFGFGNKANLILAAANGATYALGSWWAGRLAAKIGYFNALKLGFGIMGGAVAVGSQMTSAPAHIAVMLTNVVGMCFTWPVLEALVSEGESPAEVPHVVGVYNVVWAATGACAYFVGGALLDLLSLKAMFYVPLGIAVTQLAITAWLQRRVSSATLAAALRTPLPVPVVGGETGLPAAEPQAMRATMPARHQRPPRAKTFLRMAWLANPFGYIAINTVIAVIPGVARKLGLSTMEAGFVCSLWGFARLAAFTQLWLWTGWHYRFGWLFAAFLGLALSFAGILMLPSIPGLILAQLVFGWAIGLLYYSSLYYSMDASETKSEHGGIHEAAIGMGNLAGPAVGAASLHFLPQYANSGAVAVSLLLLCGLGGLVAIWRSDHA